MKSVMGHGKPDSSYRSILMSEMMRRMKVNPAYSLRRFAQQIGVSPATLSGILNGRRRLSPRSAGKIAEKLDLPPQQAGLFYQSAMSELSPAWLKTRTQESLGNGSYKTLSEDIFQFLSDWYYYAILE